MANPEHFKILNQGVEAWNKWRSEENWVADLSGLDLSRRDLSGFDFCSATLHRVTFTGANLRRAKFRQSRLLDSNFTAANLSECDFTFAALDHVKFVGCDLTSANFFKGEMGYTIFAFTSFKETVGLKTCRHLAPTSIDLDTLCRSEHLPEEFVRGCGLPEGMLDLARSIRSGPAIQWQSCFISHSTKDEEFARRLDSRMRQANMRVWFAPEDIKGGTKLHEQLFEAIQIHERLLLVLSEHSIKSEWVMAEIRKAREVEKRENRRKLFPVRLVNFDTLRAWTCFDADTGMDLAAEVRQYFIPDFSNWKDHDAFEKAFAKLQHDLSTKSKPDQD